MCVFGAGNFTPDYQANNHGVLEYGTLTNHNCYGATAGEPTLPWPHSVDLLDRPTDPEAFLLGIGFNTSIERDQTPKYASEGTRVARKMVDA